MYVKKIYLTYVSKHISNREKQVIILMIPNVEGREAKSDLPGNKTYPTSLCTSQWRRNMPQMKHLPMSQLHAPTMSYWNFVTTFQEEVIMTSHQYVSTKSQTSLKLNTKQRLSGTSLIRFIDTYPQHPASTSPQRLL